MESREQHNAAASSSGRPLPLPPSWTSPRDKWVFSFHNHMVFGPLMKRTAGATSTCWGNGFCKEDYQPAEGWAEAARGQFSGGVLWECLSQGFGWVLLEISGCSLQNQLKQKYDQSSDLIFLLHFCLWLNILQKFWLRNSTGGSFLTSVYCFIGCIYIFC